MGMNPDTTEHGRILFHDIGDYLNRTEKLDMIAEYRSIQGIPSWQTIVPDQHGDWLNQRDDSFGEHIVLGDKKDDGLKLFDNYSMGIKTNRDSWVYNFSTDELIANASTTINFYNQEMLRFQACKAGKGCSTPSFEEFANYDPTGISWSRALRENAQKGITYTFDKKNLTTGLYRPFSKQKLYFSKELVNDVALMPRIFPNAEVDNLVIAVTGRGST